jgi:hypothetical protein
MGEDANMSWLDTFQEAWGITDLVRSRLPWQWQPYVSNYLIWSGVFLATALLMLCLHFGLREKPKIDWRFHESGNPLGIGSRQITMGGPIEYLVHGIRLEGRNISGHPLHQVFGDEIRHRDDQSKLPLFINTADGIGNTDDVDTIPPLAILAVGSEFRSDTPHWQQFDHWMSPEEFLKSFGGFTVEISIDGVKQKWTFTIDQLREVIDATKKATKESIARSMPPEVRLRRPH